MDTSKKIFGEASAQHADNLEWNQQLTYLECEIQSCKQLINRSGGALKSASPNSHLELDGKCSELMNNVVELKLEIMAHERYIQQQELSEQSDRVKSKFFDKHHLISNELLGIAEAFKELEKQVEQKLAENVSPAKSTSAAEKSRLTYF